MLFVRSHACCDLVLRELKADGRLSGQVENDLSPEMGWEKEGGGGGGVVSLLSPITHYLYPA